MLSFTTSFIWGLTPNETARVMRISIRKIRLLMKGLQAKIPQLFPILTHRQHTIYWLYVIKGLTTYKIADYLHTTQSNIWEILNRIKKKGVLFTSQRLLIILNYEHKTGLTKNRFTSQTCPYLMALDNIDNIDRPINYG